MRLVFFAVLAVSLVGACGGKLQGSTDGGTDGASGVCCPPSASPGCCMSFGGWSESGACGASCDGMPTPDNPGWKQSTDAHGCTYWQQPSIAGPVCGGIPPDASPPPPTCPTPADVSTFVPPPFIPPVVQKGSCTTQQIQDFYTACFSPNNNPTQCNAFNQANKTCASCIMTTPPTPGPLVAEGTAIVELNVAGCVALVTGDSGPTSCGARLQAINDCENAACLAQCPVNDGSSFQLYQQCVQAAASGGCSKFVMAQCGGGDAGIDGGIAPQCTDFVDFQTGYMNIVPLFCGP